MRLTYSSTGIPYIEIDEETRLIFTKTWKGQKNYKWISVRAVEVLNGEVGKGKRRYLFTQTTPINFMTDFKLRGFPRGFTKKHPSLTKITHNILKKVLSKYCVNDPENSDMLLFPENKLTHLEVELEKMYAEEDE